MIETKWAFDSWNFSYEILDFLFIFKMARTTTNLTLTIFNSPIQVQNMQSCITESFSTALMSIVISHSLEFQYSTSLR